MRLLRLTANWCGPCKALSKTFQEVNVEFPMDVIDIDIAKGVAEQFNVRSVPTVIATVDGREVARFTGIKSAAQLQDWLDELKEKHAV